MRDKNSFRRLKQEDLVVSEEKSWFKEMIDYLKQEIEEMIDMVRS